ITCALCNLLFLLNLFLFYPLLKIFHPTALLTHYRTNQTQGCCPDTLPSTTSRQPPTGATISITMTTTAATDHLHQNHNDSMAPREEDDDQEQQQQENPRSPKSLTLDSPDHQNPPDSPISLQQDQNQDEDDPDYVISVTNLHVTTNTRRNHSKRNKAQNKRRVAQERKSRKKLEILKKTLKPVPFVPSKTLDFSRHETLLKRLGLWDFVHLELDRTLRGDLLVQLIATFNPTSRSSYVNGVRIKLTRADLARALKLPGKRDKVNVPESGSEVKESEDSRAFMEEFVSNWVLLHEDTWVVPEYIFNFSNVIKEGNLEKVDWAGLIWFMMEKELTEPQLEDCYYASHMQCLIKCQRKDLFEEDPVVDVDVKEEEEEELEAEAEDVKMETELLEEHNIELSLGGQENVTKEDDAERGFIGNDEDGIEMDFEVSKEEEEQHEQHGQWLSHDKNSGSAFDVFLRRCNQPDEGGMSCVQEKKDEGEGEEEEEEEDEGREVEEDELDGRFHIAPKVDTLGGVTSTNLLAAMDEEQIPFGLGVQIPDGSSGELLASRVDTRTVPGGSMPFANGNKRGFDHDNDVAHISTNGGNKRLRSQSSWNDASSEFGMCLEQAQHWIGKARMMYEAKEQAYEDLNMNQQIFINELQERDSMIVQLQHAKYEEQHKRTVEVRRLENELCMMQNVLESYRKALKETHTAFAKYRKLCPVPEEPIYKDVAGSGGLVLSTMELERIHLKREEEERMNRLLIERKIKDFEAEWIGKFQAHNDGVHLLGSRLVDAEKEVKLIKESSAKNEKAEASECAAPSEE
ncbi:hypothetical protein CFOL_v3_19459, partial [Cephalotus follicularis]